MSKPSAREIMRERIIQKLDPASPSAGKLTHRELCERLRLDPKQIMDELETMRREGLTEQVGQGANSAWRLVRPVSARPQPSSAALRTPAALTPGAATLEDALEHFNRINELTAQRTTIESRFADRHTKARQQLEQAQQLVREAEAEIQRVLREGEEATEQIDLELAERKAMLRRMIEG
jgi:predicted ribosome quality control (RQC) complex YloA/Tae2 family protein